MLIKIKVYKSYFLKANKSHGFIPFIVISVYPLNIPSI